MVFGVDQNINLIPTEPNLKDLLDFFKKQIKLELNCHHIGKIALFNPLNQTAQVNIVYTKTFSQVDDIGIQTVTTVNYPMLLECPVICLGGGDGSLTFPIETGDECLVLFNDRDIDTWFSTGGSSSAPNTGRLHSFTDGIALVGIRSMPNVLTDYSSSAVTLTYGLNTIQIFETKVLISLSPTTSLEIDSTGVVKITNETGELLSTLANLFNDVQTGLVMTMLGPMPLVMPEFAEHYAILESFT